MIWLLLLSIGPCVIPFTAACLAIRACNRSKAALHEVARLADGVAELAIAIDVEDTRRLTTARVELDKILAAPHCHLGLPPYRHREMTSYASARNELLAALGWWLRVARNYDSPLSANEADEVAETLLKKLDVYLQTRGGQS